MRGGYCILYALSPFSSLFPFSDFILFYSIFYFSPQPGPRRRVKMAHFGSLCCQVCQWGFTLRSMRILRVVNTVSNFVGFSTKFFGNLHHSVVMAFVTGSVVFRDVSESFRNLPMVTGRCPMCLLVTLVTRRFTKAEVLALE